MTENKNEKKEKHYLVVWKIDIFTDNPRDAAQEARNIQLDPDSTANVFEVSEVVDANGKHTPVVIDLDDLDDLDNKMVK